MKLFEPVDGAGEQEVSHLFAAIVEDQGAPVAVFSLAWVFMLIQRRTVEAGQGMGILGEMSRYPVEDDTYSLLMKMIDEIAEVIR